MPSAPSDSDRRLDQRLPAEIAGLRRFLGRLCGRSDLVDDLLQDTPGPEIDGRHTLVPISVKVISGR